MRNFVKNVFLVGFKFDFMICKSYFKPLSGRFELPSSIYPTSEEYRLTSDQGVYFSACYFIASVLSFLLILHTAIVKHFHFGGHFR